MQTTNSSTDENKPYFFAISPLKFTVMSIVSFGFYELWWSFKNWLYVQQSSGKKLLPFIRAWFSLFFLHSLLKEMHTTGDRLGVQPTFSPFRVFLGWVVLSFSGTVLQMLSHIPSMKANTFFMENLARVDSYLSLVALFSFVPLLSAQKNINDLNLKLNPNVPINSTFTKGNWAIIVIGGIWLCFSLVAIFRPDLAQ